MPFEPIVHLIAEDGAEPGSLTAMLSSEGFDVRSHPDASAFLNATGEPRTGCVIVDLQRPCAIETVRRIRAGEKPLPTIVVSALADVSVAVRAMKAGAADFLVKPVDRGALVAALRGAGDADRTMSERDARADELRRKFETLSSREIQVVDAILKGAQNKKVAALLGISPRTVETHRSNAMTKLGVRTLAGLVRIWVDRDGATTS